MRDLLPLRHITGQLVDTSSKCCAVLAATSKMLPSRRHIDHLNRTWHHCILHHAANWMSGWINSASHLHFVRIGCELDHMVVRGALNFRTPKQISPVDEFVTLWQVLRRDKNFAEYFRLLIVVDNFDSVVATGEVGWAIRNIVIAAAGYTAQLSRTSARPATVCDVNRRLFFHYCTSGNIFGLLSGVHFALFALLG